MNSLPMTTAEKMLFALLKAALHGNAGTEVCWKSCTDEDWQQCYKLASTHGVMALAWDGIALQNDGCVPPRALKLTWGLAVQSYEEKYERYCGTVADLQDFYAQNNIAMVQLKGVFAILRYKTKRLLYIHRMQAMIFDHSLWRRIWDSIVVHIRKPKTILMRG